jgi:exodeoxyribonuclease VII small subunit
VADTPAEQLDREEPALPATGGARRAQHPEEAPRYEEIVQKLGRVVEKLEGGGLSLEESIAQFEEGIKLARAGAKRLEDAEGKVEKLLEGDRTAPFTGQEK